MFSTPLPATTLALFLLASGAAQAQNSDGGALAQTLPWNKVQELVQHFEEIAPQPPPLETVLLGTFDAATGDFIWGPALELWHVPVDAPYDNLAIAPAFDLHGIEPLSVDLSPQVMSLSSIGTTPPAALAKPGHGQGRPSQVNAQAPTQAGQGQRFRGHPLTQGVMRTFVRAAKIAFVVEVVNRQPEQSVTFSIDGSTAQASADLIDVIVPPRTRHSFEVRSGTQLFADKLLVFRPPLIGTFTLEALPVTIVYEPPGGSGCSQTYTSVHRAGTEIRSFRTTDAGSTEAIDTPIGTLNEYCEIAKSVGGVAQSAPYPAVSTAGSVVSGAASVLQAAFGSLSVNQEVSATVTATHRLVLEVTEGSSTTTSEGLGPGQGDVFHFLVKPTFVWIVAQDFQSGSVFVSTALLGHNGLARYSARSLREHTMAVPPAQMQDLLLALDPLAPEYGAAGLKPRLAPFGGSGRLASAPRVVPLAAPMVYLSGASGSFWLSHTLTTSDENARVDVTTTTTKSTAGFLSYVTSEVPGDEDSRMSVQQGSSSASSTSDTVDVRVDLTVPSGADGMVLEVSFDRLFGTFTFKEIGAQAQFMSGTVSDGSGSPLGNEPMLLTFADGRSMRARTDKQGRFSIRPPLKAAGSVLLSSGGARTTIDWNGTARTGIELRGGVAAAREKPKKSGGKQGLPDPKTVPVTASEGSTAGAIRGKPGQEESRRVAELQAEVDRLQARVRELSARLASLEGGAQEGQPTPARARKDERAGAVELVPDAALRGRLGRLTVLFPEGAKVSGCPIEASAGEKAAGSSYGSFAKDLMPGEYVLEIQKRRLDRIEVRTGHVTRVHAGVLRLQGAEGTAFELFEPGAKKAFFNCYGPQDVGLPPGAIEVGIAGQRAKVEILADRIVEF